ncbi:MAG: hypothetical protein IRZ16_04820 [Myxococcaceae bacterium]|nr:hypothetical protein [Myxococcaceae bacterium]
MGANIKDQRPQHTDEHELDRGFKEAFRKQQKELSGGGAKKTSYGKKFAETEALYRAHMMERELEELAREDERPLAPEAPGPGRGGMYVEARAPRKKAGGAGPAIEEVIRGAPIGAVPPVAEPPPRSGFSELLGDARRYFHMVRGGLHDVVTGSRRLVRLPFEAVAMARGKLRLRRV